MMLGLYKLRFAILIDIALRLSCLAFSVAVMEHPLCPPPHLPHTLQSFLNLPPATRGPDFYKQGEPSQVLHLSLESSALRLAYGGIMLGRDVVHRGKKTLFVV